MRSMITHSFYIVNKMSLFLTTCDDTFFNFLFELFYQYQNFHKLSLVRLRVVVFLFFYLRTLADFYPSPDSDNFPINMFFLFLCFFVYVAS